MCPAKRKVNPKAKSRKKATAKKKITKHKVIPYPKASRKKAKMTAAITFAFPKPPKPKAEALIYSHMILVSGIESVSSLAKTHEKLSRKGAPIEA